MLQTTIGSLLKELETTKEMKQEEIQKLIDKAVEPHKQALAAAYDEINRLKSIINKDSSNSSKPPDSDGFKKIPNNREPSKRNKGGQKDHPGHRLKLPDNIDELIEQGLVIKGIEDHTSGNEDYIVRYVLNVSIVTTLTEHRFALATELPKNMYNEVSYGDSIKALIIMLQQEGIIAEGRLADMIASFTHGIVTISPATIEKIHTDFAKQLVISGELEAIINHLLNGKILYTDDTPLDCTETLEYGENGDVTIKTAEGTSFSPTLRTHSNDLSTFLTVNPQKNKDGIIRDNILPRFFGILCHDHESKFYSFGSDHSTCGEHLCRDLKGLRDLQMVPWAATMRSFILSMNNHKNKDLAEERTQCDPQTLSGFIERFNELLEQGRYKLSLISEDSWNYTEFNRMINRLTEHKYHYLLFMIDYDAPFTNNQSERDLRIEKTKLKVSGAYRSWKGMVNRAQIRSFISTLKKRKQDLYSAITDVITGKPVLAKTA